MSESGSEPGARPPGRSLSDAVVELMEAVIDWFDHEVETVVREKIVLPSQKLGLMLVAAVSAGCLAVVGILFLMAGVFMLLGEAIGYAWTLLLLGAVLLVKSAIFLAIRFRNTQQ